MFTLVAFPLVWLSVSHGAVSERGADVLGSAFKLPSSFISNYFMDITIPQEPASVEVTRDSPLALAPLGPLISK